jgi:hypothetical protein
MQQCGHKASVTTSHTNQVAELVPAHMHTWKHSYNQ